LEDGDRGRSLLDEPLEFLGRLAVLVPRPRINLILYYGVLGARAAWRRQVVSARPEAEGASGGAAGVPEPETDSAGAQPRGYLWAALMKRTFGFDVLACPGCGGGCGSRALMTQIPGPQRIGRYDTDVSARAFRLRTHLA
jgi:hypothetical protein